MAVDVNDLITDAAVKQIDKLKAGLDQVVQSIADINQAGAKLDAQLNAGNLGWAKTIGKMKEVAANGQQLEEAYKRLVAANDALHAAEARHASRLAQLAEHQRTQALLNEKVTITNNKVKDSTLKVTDAINAKQKAQLRAQVTASEGIKVNTRATLAEKAHTVELEKQASTLAILIADNKALIAQRNAVDISTVAGIAKVKELNKGITENTKIINANTTANETTFGTIGKGATKALSYLRNLAYILPGIGIAGIFNGVIEGLSAMFTGLMKATGAQKLLSDAMGEAGKASAFEVWNLDRLYKKTQDTTISIEKRQEAVDKLQKMFPDYFKDIKDEAILNGEAKGSYDELRTSIVAVAKAKAAEAAIQKVFADGLDEEILLIKALSKANADEATNRGKPRTSKQGGLAELGTSDLQYTAKEADEYRKREKHRAQEELFAFRSKQAEKLRLLGQFLDDQEKLISDKTREKETKATRTPRGAADLQDDSPTAYLNAKKAEFLANYQLMKEDAEKQAEINKQIAESDEKVSKNKHDLLGEYYDYKQRLLLLDNKAGMHEIAMNNEITDKYAQELFDRQDALAAYYANKQNLLDLEETKELKELEFHNIAIQNKMIQMQTKLDRGKLNAYNTKVVQNELKAEQFLYDENLKTIATIIEKYNKEQLGTTEQFKAANLALIKKYDQKEIEAVIERWKWIKNFNEQAAKEELELIQGNLDAYATMADDTDRYPPPTEESKYLFEKKMYFLGTYLEMEQTATTILMGLADAQYAHEMGLIDKREQKLNESYDEDKKRIMSSFTTKVDQDNELLKLDARKEALQKQIDRDRKAAARKQAKDQKASDVANIIGSTYVAVMGALGAKPWTFANIAVAAGIGATGAANLARVIATPLPQYKDGTRDAAGGWSIVGDGGKRELVTEPGKKPWITDSVPTLVNLPKHTIVEPDAETALRGANLISLFANNVSSTNDKQTPQLMAKIDELIEETRNNKSITNVDIIDFSNHTLHVRKNIR